MITVSSIKYKVLGINALKIVVAVFILNALFLIPHTAIVRAQTAEELQAKIDQRNQDIKNLEAEMKKYQSQIDDLGSQATSLASTIKSLQLTQKKLETNIAVTQDKIAAKTFEIQRLGSQISTKQNNISDDQRIVTQSFKQLDQMGNTTITDIILGSNSVSGALNTLEELGQVQKNIFIKIDSLNRDKNQLEVNKNASEKAKAELLSLNQQLADQRKVVLATAADQTLLLKQTSQSEANYKKLLAKSKAEQDAFERDLLQLQSALNIKISGASLPRAGAILSFPLSSMHVTQSFGNTDFATANPQMYKGSGHPGIDLRASIGSEVRSAANGIVSQIENRSRSGCGYGKWVVVKHSNGLSTLYAHLSLVAVGIGQTVSSGNLIGYSGSTGASTGPHLHFGVYATEGLVFQPFTKCSSYLVPVADFTAILNPLSYLPAL